VPGFCSARPMVLFWERIHGDDPDTPEHRARETYGSPMSIAFLFPGQGSQVAGMLHALPDHPAVARTLREASEAYGDDIRAIDTPDALRSTICAQLALLTTGVSVARALLQESVRPAALAGLSVGAFGAAVVSGALSMTDAVRIVRQRAEKMVQLFPHGYGLGVIVGISESRVHAWVAAVAAKDPEIFLANVNSPSQMVVGGSLHAIDAVLRLARTAGARRAEVLSVPVPSHGPLLEPVEAAVRMEMPLGRMHHPRIPCIGNVNTDLLRTREAIAEDLARSIAHQVRWHRMTMVLRELGCDLYLEMPPGHVLSDLSREAAPDIRTLALGDGSLSDATYLACVNASNSGCERN
jgi:malonate decarboxylase epsilon subunit